MEMPAEVLIHNQTMGLKGTKGTLVRISSDGYYEANCRFGERLHRLLLPIHETILISQLPEDTTPLLEVER